jgi:3-oxoacyl-[acyl-carrier protein] reductase
VSLKGKRALVTGGSRGIGSAIAKRFAKEGADVAITFAGNKAAADTTIAAIEAYGRKAWAIQADAGDAVSTRPGFKVAGSVLGTIDILVHNAGMTAMALIGEETDDAFDRVRRQCARRPHRHAGCAALHA